MFERRRGQNCDCPQVSFAVRVYQEYLCYDQAGEG